MSLRDDLQNDLAEAFNTDLADAVQSFVLEHFNRAVSSYDTSTGVNTRVPSQVSSRGVFGQYTQQERFNTHIEATDIKLLVLANEIAIEPKLRDNIINAAGIEYRVINVMKDAAGATYTLHIRGIRS